MRVTLQDSCHLRNGLGVWREPRTLLERFVHYVELPGADTCCGAAGTYSLLRPKESRTIIDAKIDAIEEAGVDHPGCLRQPLQQALRRRKSTVRAMHIADFLAQAVPRQPHERQG